MSSCPFRQFFARPPHFSDPTCEWTGFDLPSILAKRDEELMWFDFHCIFHRHVPAASFGEGAYFLPVALAYLRGNPHDATKCIEHIIWFTSRHAQDLKRHRLFDACSIAFSGCLADWTSIFEVNLVVGPGPESEWIISNAAAVSMLLEGLCEEQEFASVAEHFICSLAHVSGDLVKSAWYLELVHQFLMEDLSLTDAAGDMLIDEAMIARQAHELRSAGNTAPGDPVYWKRVFSELGL